MGKRVGSVVGLVAMSLLAACSSFGAEDEPKQPDGTTPGRPDDPKKNAPPPSTTTPPASEVTEQFGYFVAEKGNDETGDGTRAKPFATLGKGLSKAKVDGKRIYVCSGKYIEAVTLEDGVSMIGSYDCAQPEWSMGAKKSRIESPTSPALRAKDIKSVTRFEGFDVVAPDATEPSGSSIGLIAEGSEKLTIVSSRIVAGSGAAGKAGVEGIQLQLAPGADGALGLNEYEYCGFGTCLKNPPAAPNPYPGQVGGVSSCIGEAGHNGTAGGRGGSGSMYQSRFNAIINDHAWVNTGGVANMFGEVKSGAAGKDGQPGASTPTVGTFSPDGFAAANGAAGENGSPGEGGSGGDGQGPPNAAARTNELEYWRARAGGSGGAGGCPGLAGTAGGGGGASVGVLLFASPVSFEKSEILAAVGGTGGRGTFGSEATAGGAGGSGPGAPGMAGGAGGHSGVSGSGAGGPSFAIAHTGAAPKLTSTTPKAGKGGAGVGEEVRNGKTLSATPAGESKDVFAF